MLTRGACEWRLAVRIDPALVRGPLAVDACLAAGRHLIRRLLIDSRDALGDLPPLLIRAELPAFEISVAANAEGAAASDAAERAAAEANAAAEAGAATGAVAGVEAGERPAGRPLAARRTAAPPSALELCALSLRSVRLRWSSLGQRRGWQLRVRTLLAIDLHDLDDLSLVPLLREKDVSFTVLSVPARNPASSADARSLSLGIDGEHLELHVGPAACQLLSALSTAGWSSPPPMSTAVCNETPLELAFGQVIASDCF